MENPVINAKMLKKTYDGLSYFDQYGSSLLLFIFVSIVLFLLVSCCFALIYAQPIRDDWARQRCNPYVIPIAGIINAPKGQSATDFTKENFDYCTQNIVKGITGNAVQPLTFITSLITDLFSAIQNSINTARAMFNKIRLSIRAIGEEIMGRIMNIMAPLQQIILCLKDMLAKTQGILTAGLYTLLGSYYTLKSLLSTIAQLIVTVLIAMAILIVVLWMVPFTWTAAAFNTAIFVSVSIPMALILSFLSSKLGVRIGMKIPQIKCFDKLTPIRTQHGKYVTISELNVGDVLWEDDMVTAVIKVTTAGSIMYNLNDIIVSDTHFVWFKDKWVKTADHPDAIRLNDYDCPQLYCLNTASKCIKVGNQIFSDWDEIFDSNINIFKKALSNKKITKFHTKNIHEFLDGGFAKDTDIELNDGKTKKIYQIKVDDVLKGGAKVYGLVTINGSSLINQYKYNLGNNKYIKGGVNLNFYVDDKIVSTMSVEDSNKTQINPMSKLYHLLTNTNTFYVCDMLFLDYNSAADTVFL